MTADGQHFDWSGVTVSRGQTTPDGPSLPPNVNGRLLTDAEYADWLAYRARALDGFRDDGHALVQDPG